MAETSRSRKRPGEDTRGAEQEQASSLSATFVRESVQSQCSEARVDAHGILGLTPETGSFTSSSGVVHGACINLTDSNVGFKLLKKSGWKEGSGLGASEQGRVNPVETRIKVGRLGIGSEKGYTKSIYSVPRKQAALPSVIPKAIKVSKMEKKLSKKAKKALDEDRRIQEQQFARDFFREFWPDNV